MNTSLCGSILPWYQGSTGAVKTRGEYIVVIGTQDNEKLDKDFQAETVSPRDILQKVCRNKTDWRSGHQSNRSPANEPGFNLSTCFSNWCYSFHDLVGFVAPLLLPLAGSLSIWVMCWVMSPTALELLQVFFKQKMCDIAQPVSQTTLNVLLKATEIKY